MSFMYGGTRYFAMVRIFPAFAHARYCWRDIFTFHFAWPMITDLFRAPASHFSRFYASRLSTAIFTRRRVKLRAFADFTRHHHHRPL